MASLLHPLSEKQLLARRQNARKSTGPRSAQGKQRAALNALRWGGPARAALPALLALDEQPQEYTRLLLDLLDAHRPLNAAERLLVEDLAGLRWQRLRNQRAQTGQLRCQLERLLSAHRRRFLELQNEGCEVPQAEVLEKGLLHVPDSRGKFQQLSDILEVMIAQLERGEIGPDWDLFIRTLYGARPSLRGAAIYNTYESLRRARYQPPETVVEAVQGEALDTDAPAPEASGTCDDDSSPADDGGPESLSGEADAESVLLERQFVELQATLLEEAREVAEKYELYLQEEIAITPGMRDACFVPQEPGWVMLIRQENSIDRRIERKTRLLLQLQSAWKARKHRARGEWRRRKAPLGAPARRAPHQHG